MGNTPHHTSLHCTALHCTTLHYTALNCTALHYTALHYTTLHYTTLHYTAQHNSSLHRTALHRLHVSGQFAEHSQEQCMRQNDGKLDLIDHAYSWAQPLHVQSQGFQAFFGAQYITQLVICV